MSWLKKMFGGAESVAFQEGKDAYAVGDYATAIAKLTPLAEAGIPEAQCALGMMYVTGSGVELNHEKAMELFRPAAEAGIPEAQFNLALAYAKGDGVLQDGCLAYVWAALAAAQNYGNAPILRDEFADNMPPEELAEAQFNLGFKYETGEGVAPDFEEAVKWYRLAAEAGNTDGQTHLGGMYLTGKGIEQDFEEAVKWMRLAADAGNATAQYSLSTLYVEGRGVPQDYKEAIKLTRLAAKAGFPNAQTALGSHYQSGLGIKQNYVEAEKWYRLAAEAGFAPAQCNLGLLYGEGKAVEEDYILAYMWLFLAACQGYERAKTLLEGMSTLMNPEQITEAEMMALKRMTHEEIVEAEKVTRGYARDYAKKL